MATERSHRPRCRSLLGVALVLAALPACARGRASQPPTPLAQTRSPHGSSTVDCARCHQPASWVPVRQDARFDHSRETGFPLSGRHVQVDCGGCHLGLAFDEPHAAPGDCGVCHVDVHGGRLGPDCQTCHDTRSFAASRPGDAHASTTFPLAGMHRQVPCEACHGGASGQPFVPLRTDCVACHADDYAAAVPDHGRAGFPRECGSCHGLLGWSGARFDHRAAAGYPLDGAHIRVACQTCHVPPDFALRFVTSGPRDCIACHRSDYDRVHPDLGLSVDCLGCHTVETFRGARWAEHEARFPISSGPHARRWTTCAECHVGPAIATVSCLGCHEHSRQRMDDKHKERTGYNYDTAACLSCHPTGRKD